MARLSLTFRLVEFSHINTNRLKPVVGDGVGTHAAHACRMCQILGASEVLKSTHVICPAELVSTANPMI